MSWQSVWMNDTCGMAILAMHEHEQGSLVLHPHAITRDLTLAEVSPSPFREHWLKEGCEEFRPLERI